MRANIAGKLNMFNIARNIAGNIAGNIASNIVGVDVCISRNFRKGCWKLAQCGWVSNTVASNTAGNIAWCGCPFKHFNHLDRLALCIASYISSCGYMDSLFAILKSCLVENDVATDLSYKNFIQNKSSTGPL